MRTSEKEHPSNVICQECVDEDVSLGWKNICSKRKQGNISY